MRLWRRRASEAPATEPAAGTTTMAGASAPVASEPAARSGATRAQAPSSSAPLATAPAQRPREGLGHERGEAGEPPRRRRRGVARRTHDAAGATAGAIGSGVLVLARLVMTIATLIALLIALAIILRDVDANASNSIVKGIHEGANFFAGAFTGLIKFSGHPKRAITIDWGIALIVYLLVGALIARLIAGVGRSGLRFERRHRAIPAP